jgi:hypothetical protein
VGLYCPYEEEGFIVHMEGVFYSLYEGVVLYCLNGGTGLFSNGGAGLYCPMKGWDYEAEGAALYYRYGRRGFFVRIEGRGFIVRMEV